MDCQLQNKSGQERQKISTLYSNSATLMPCEQTLAFNNEDVLHFSHLDKLGPLFLPNFEFRCPPSFPYPSIRSPYIDHTRHLIPSITVMSAPKLALHSPARPDATTVRVNSKNVDDKAIYEHYLRLPELSGLWGRRDFPNWYCEPVIKPALQALEITFRLLSITLSDQRPYTNHRQWKRSIQSLAAGQIKLIATLCEGDIKGAPVMDLSTSTGVLGRDRSSQEVWKLPGTSAVVSRTSAVSLLPRLAAWDKSEDIANSIMFLIEAEMRRCPFTLGLGEPNLAGKSNLEYDLIVRPSELHSLKRSPTEKNLPENQENQILFTVHQIVESWICVARELLSRIEHHIYNREWNPAADDCWILEHIWKLLSDAEDMLLLMDPDDFLRLKNELSIHSGSCFGSVALTEMTVRSRELRRTVPQILKADVDPNGGPRVQHAAMALFHSQDRGEAENAARIHLLQAFQAVEAALKRFFFAYRQMMSAVIGNVEATGNRGVTTVEPSDSLSDKFLDPPYFPSLDAAKTFLGERWRWQK